MPKKFYEIDPWWITALLANLLSGYDISKTFYFTTFNLHFVCDAI